jgi:hypothetical protein
MITALAPRRLGRSLAFVLVFGACTASVTYAQRTIGGCPVLPGNNIWNTAVDALPVLPNSASMVTTIGENAGFHADFGSGTWDGGPIGIPFIAVSAAQTAYPATFLYWDESDPGPYAVPLNAPIEGGSNASGDRHAIAIDTQRCILYELYNAYPQSASWSADSGAIYDLRSNALRPSGWTSADAAGLPIVPGLVTYDEVASGEITHAIRFTVPKTRNEFVWPARHRASSLTGSQYPRMGERFRLKASVNISSYPADVQVILRAMKKYGIMVADNGSAWYISGAPDNRWNNDSLHALGQLRGSNFEAVDATVLRIDANSGAAIQNGVTVSVSPSLTGARTGGARMFAATVTGAPGGVTWSVNDIPGGNAVVGTIDASGGYIAPTMVPSPDSVTVRATSTSSTTSSGSATLYVLAPLTVSSVNPSSFPTGNFTLTINGTGFIPGATVLFGGTALTTTYVSAAQLKATGNASAANPSVPVVVTTPDNQTSSTVYVAVTTPTPAQVAVTISPTSTTVRVRRTKQFTASVKNSSNKAVIWKVNGIPGGNASVGTITSSGVYLAPNGVPNPAVVAVSATAAADQTKSATASVTISR